MKTNKFKNIVEKEDGTRTYHNENLWMHSVERPVGTDEQELAEIVKCFALVIGMGTLAFLTWLIVGV